MFSRFAFRSKWSAPLVPAVLLAVAAPLQAQEPGEAGPDADADRTAAIEAAESAAIEWLELVDAGDYAASYELGAAVLRDAVTEAQWQAAVDQARGAVGELGERTRTQAQYAVDPPNAPAGEFVMLRFSTETGDGNTVTETVVPMLEDGVWKVSGYFVQP